MEPLLMDAHVAPSICIQQLCCCCPASIWFHQNAVCKVKWDSYKSAWRKREKGSIGQRKQASNYTNRNSTQIIASFSLWLSLFQFSLLYSLKYSYTHTHSLSVTSYEDLHPDFAIIGVPLLFRMLRDPVPPPVLSAEYVCVICLAFSLFLVWERWFTFTYV